LGPQIANPHIATIYGQQIANPQIVTFAEGPQVFLKKFRSANLLICEVLILFANRPCTFGAAIPLATK
jgi:hypothetical protein